MQRTKLLSPAKRGLLLILPALAFGSVSAGCHHAAVHHTHVDYRVAQPDDHRFGQDRGDR